MDVVASRLVRLIAPVTLTGVLFFPFAVFAQIDPDTTAPALYQVHAVPAVTNDAAPDYTFHTDEAGTITYGGDCSSQTTDAVMGDNTITFDTLADGEHNNCSVAVTDAVGNVNVGLHISGFAVDATPPLITLTGSSTVMTEVLTTYEDFGATAVDAYDGGIATSSISAVSTVDTTNVGTYTVTYTVSDQAGNAAIPVVRTVHVVDTTAPVITLTGDTVVNVPYAGTYTELGATAMDTYDGAVTVITSGDTVLTSTPGTTYHVTYDAVDAAGNHATRVMRSVVIGNRHNTSSGSGGGSGGSAPSTGSITPAVGQVLGASTYNFKTNLTVGSKGADVIALQQILIDAGFLYIPTPTGYFGQMTKAAVKLYQQARGIVPVSGYVGPLTRAVLNLGTVSIPAH